MLERKRVLRVLTFVPRFEYSRSRVHERWFTSPEEQRVLSSSSDHYQRGASPKIARNCHTVHARVYPRRILQEKDRRRQRITESNRDATVLLDACDVSPCTRHGVTYETAGLKEHSSSVAYKVAAVERGRMAAGTQPGPSDLTEKEREELVSRCVRACMVTHARLPCVNLRGPTGPWVSWVSWSGGLFCRV